MGVFSSPLALIFAAKLLLALTGSGLCQAADADADGDLLPPT